MSGHEALREWAGSYLRTLCVDIGERVVGSEGNRRATRFFEKRLRALGWQTEVAEFEAMDWADGGASLDVAGASFDVRPSPYSLGCSVEAELVAASTIEELEALDCAGRIVLLHGGIAREQLMPKGFVFYNPESHRRIVARLESCGARALVCATGRNAALAGGVYPFPLIEDGDFDVPSVFTTEEEGPRLLGFVGRTARLESRSERVAGTGCNVLGRRGAAGAGRVVLTAHIDAKKGTPGAIDNGTGVVVLLLLAELLGEYAGPHRLEIVALNGEDYWAVPGQMKYIEANHGRFDDVLVNVNIDGAGYREGPSAFSFFGLTPALHRAALEVMAEHAGVVEGAPWPQGDHSIFVQHGRPAIAASSKWFIDHMADQTITHTPADEPGIVDLDRVVELARAIAAFVARVPAAGR